MFKKKKYKYILKTVNKCFCGGDSYRQANASDGLICNNCGCLFVDTSVKIKEDEVKDEVKNENRFFYFIFLA